ncbi:PREDICTED: nutritionally-regulated adipose and cardiac enriched protein homolog [Gavialis gangeticus]|uniref:nutritionally-regulated adipose and cardiac enriched protein homolog n=1 Tax=Gavialis gangeticus TaxID=94835 RepID=UPI00092EB9A8|nr:PREDICTED: nutritionally-regulated adipose and cardiac enriched protein homolog [Gavialis gangeticus]
MRFLNSEDLFMLECKYPDVLRPGKAGRPNTSSVKTLQEAAGSRSSDHFRSPEAADVLQHEEEPAGTPVHRREMTNCSNCPPSILRKRPPVNQAVGEKRKSERRVRFQEPEEIHEHGISCCEYMVAHDSSSTGLPTFLWLLFCITLILAVSLYYSSVKQNFKFVEEFQSQLVIIFLQIRHVALKCWTWFMRQ